MTNIEPHELAAVSGGASILYDPTTGKYRVIGPPMYPIDPFPTHSKPRPIPLAPWPPHPVLRPL